MASLLVEVKRRKVFQVAAVYAVVAWLLVQIVATVKAPLQLPGWFDTVVIVLLLIGFPIAVIVAWAYDFSPDGLRRTPESDAAPGDRTDEAVAGAATTEASNVTAVLPNSIGVLPFENMSPDPEHAYFAAGIHEEILNSLAKLKSLNVIARTSVMQYAGAKKPIKEIAAELGVQTIMEGSVRYARNRVRVTTQLIDAKTGAHLWSEAYEREFDDIFAIQADIAMQVADALEAELSPDEQATVTAPATRSTEAYAFYLQAMNLIARGNLAARYHELLDKAIALDPEFTLALGTKSSIYAQELINTAGSTARDQRELEPLIRKYATEALALDPTISVAHVALGLLEAFTWHWAAARAHMDRSLEFGQPGVAGAAASWFLCWSGEQDRATSFARRLAQLSPADWTAPWNLGIVLNYCGEYEEAVGAFHKSIAITPILPIHHSWLAVTEIARGNPSAALKELELTEKLLGDEREIIYLLDMGYAYGRLGDAGNARRLANEVLGVAVERDIGAGGHALASMAVQDYDAALRWLRAAADKAERHEIDTGMFSLMNLKMNVTADPVLGRPDFVEARRRLAGD
jgi:adenylate cyclase